MHSQQLKVILAIVIITAIILFLILSRLENDRLIEKLDKEYSFELNHQTILNDTISSTYYPDGWREDPEFRYVTLKGNKRIQIWAKSLERSEEANFKDVALAGALLFKDADSDTLKVKYKREVYNFILVYK
ncbi:MAG: hypothetical protein AAFX87_20245 [Bacteroidota bacterium]